MLGVVRNGLVWAKDPQKWIAWLDHAQFVPISATGDFRKYRARPSGASAAFNRADAVVVDPYTWGEDYSVDVYELRATKPVLLDLVRYDPGVSKPPLLVSAPELMLFAWYWINLVRQVLQ